MNVLILGDGTEERAWANWFACSGRASSPGGVSGTAGRRVPRRTGAGDLDEALATAGIDLAVVGGSSKLRGEALRRAAAEGLAIICLHPPGADSEAYYQVALSRQETGAAGGSRPPASACIRALHSCSRPSGPESWDRSASLRHECPPTRQ